MLLFFSIIIIINILIIIGILLSSLKIKVDDLQLNYSEQYSNIDYNIKIGLYLCDKVPIIRFKLNKKNKSKIFENEIFLEKVKKIILTNNKDKKIQIKKEYPQLKLARKYFIIEKLKLNIDIDTESIILTSYLVGAFSTIIPNILRKSIKKYNRYNYWFRIRPLYKNHNYINLKVSSIISIKVVHIINMLKKMGGKKHERTSNRRLNANCYGKY